MVGFDAKNKNTVSPEFKCLICNLVLREPVQLVCGHRQCRSCVESIDRDTIDCPECQDKTTKNEILFDRGFRNDMQKLHIECSLCDWQGPLKQYQDHSQQTHPHPECQYCGKICDSTDTLNRHKLNECEKITISCALREYGCLDAFTRFQRVEHYKSEQHQMSIIYYIRHQLSRTSSDQHDRTSGMDIDTFPHTTVTTNEAMAVSSQELLQTINILSDGVSTLNGDAQRLSNESVAIQNTIDSVTRDLSSLKLSVQEQCTYLDGIKPNLDMLVQDTESLKQKTDDLRSVSYDGTLIWKIPNFKAKMDDAQSETQTSIYSSPFYSSPTGYKMRARIYLNGDGNARRTHISLFFVLMRSEYDAILKFPFIYKVTFCLFDQTPGQKHIIDSFRPDTKSNSFQRPRSEMNIASGIPKFCPISKLQEPGNPYVVDDTIFIKVLVDFSDMPKPLLPYVLTLNPGFPVNVQQALIKQETEKQAQQAPTTPTS